ncbi:MAG: hypothetical protein Q8910_15835, partial [Bacteroidota bacterium]|nr:hypothetical protein [Bacteroidota bacterium]
MMIHFTTIPTCDFKKHLNVNKIFILVFVNAFLLLLGNKVIAQNCIIHSNSPSEICSGGYTSVGVTITSGTSPYTV